MKLFRAKEKHTLSMPGETLQNKWVTKKLNNDIDVSNLLPSLKEL